MLIRLVIMAATVGASALLGRRAINKSIETQIPAEIEAAREIATTELEKTIAQVMKDRLGAFALNLLTKAALIGGAYLFYTGGHLTAAGLKIAIVILIGIFVIRDISTFVPFAVPALKIVRQHNWNPRKALVEFIAGIVFERAYVQAMTSIEKGPKRHWIALSRYSKQSISSEVADAVADIARTTDFKKAKNRALVTGILAATMLAAYMAFFILTVSAINA